MKKIEVKVEFRKDGDYLTVVSQTHIKDNFVRESGKDGFKSSEGFEIKSCNNPAVATDPDWFFVRGTECSLNDDVVKLPNRAYTFKVLRAVYEYNKEYADEVEIIHSKNRMKADMKRLIDSVEDMLEDLEKTTDIKTLTNIKGQYMSLRFDVPMGSEHCSHCEINESRCEDCDFGKKNKKCDSDGSLWKKLNESKGLAIKYAEEYIS